MTAYFDYAATTPVRPEAVEAAVQAMTQGWGNPSARHELGSRAAADLSAWRGQIARGLGCAPEELYFTSCGTEGDNWAIYGAVETGKRVGKHIITTAYEHDAVLQPCKELERRGYEVTYLKPNRDGKISLNNLAAAIRPDTVLVSMMLVNNELGTVLPVHQAVDVVRRSGSRALFHCDAVQGFLKIPFTPAELGVDLLSISGHKIQAPKGIGALYIRKGLKFPPLIRGGGQENGMRSGTEPTAQIAAFAAAVEAGAREMEAATAHMVRMKERTLDRLTQAVPGLKQVGTGTAPHILAVTMPGYKSEVVVRFLSDRGVCVSSGSACHKGKASHVYAALNLPKKELDGVLRISFSPRTREEEVDALAQALAQAGAQLFTSLS